MCFDFYTIFLKDVKCGDLVYGCHTYDYQEGTLVFLAPGQTAGMNSNGETYQPKDHALVFHPDLIHGTSLGKHIQDYTFFGYIQAKVINVAKERIFNVDKSMSEVAYDSGFKYPQHFTRLFKQKTGMTPNEYRNRN